MDYEYIVEVRDCMRGVIIDHLIFEDANSAYHEFRKQSDRYEADELITVTLTEPE